MPAPPPRSPGRTALIGIVVGLVVLGPFAVLAGVGLGAAAADRDAAAAARAAAARGDFPTAVALDRALAGRGGPLHLLSRSDTQAATHNEQLDLLGWADALTASGATDQALATLGGVTEPGLADRVKAARAAALLDGARRAAAAGHPGAALARLDELLTAGGPSAVLAAAAAMRPALDVSQAAAAIHDGYPGEAVLLLDAARTPGAGAAAIAAGAALPGALLALGTADITAKFYPEARDVLHRLQSDFPSSAEATTAGGFLNRPVNVTGTLVDKDGHPISTSVRLGSHFRQFADGYTTSAPFYPASSNAAGDFEIDGIPVGGPYVLEFQRITGWTTLIDPKTGGASTPITTIALSPVDLGFVVIPA